MRNWSRQSLIDLINATIELNATIKKIKDDIEEMKQTLENHEQRISALESEANNE